MTLNNRSALRKSDLRDSNQRLLLNIIRQRPGTSRADIVRITGFSASSVTFVVNRMMREGLLSEARDENHTQVGRRPVTLRLRPEAMFAVGAEISPSQTRIVTADLHGNILKQRFVVWRQDPHLFLSRVRDAIRAMVGTIPKGRLLGVGVSLPGTIDRATGTVIAAEQLGWFDVEAGRVVSEGIHAPFYYENDARLGALTERWFCEPGTTPLENFVYVVLRQGLGTGVMIEGRLLHGARGEASEFGHTSLIPDGRRCPCGGTGCWEEYASQRAVERIYAERAGSGPDQPAINVEEILQLARGGDPLALEVLREVATYLGIGFANLNAAFNPEAIIVGDYLASGWDLMEGWIQEELRRRGPQRYLSRLRIIPSRHGRDSALKGALALVLSRFFTESGSNSSSAATVQSINSRRSA